MKAVRESFGLGVLEPEGPGLNPGYALAGCVTLGKLLSISEPQRVIRRAKLVGAVSSDSRCEV